MSENILAIRVMLPSAQHFASLDLPSDVINLRTLRNHLSDAGNQRISEAVTYVGELQAHDEQKLFTDYDREDGSDSLYITFVGEAKTGGLIRLYQKLLTK